MAHRIQAFVALCLALLSFDVNAAIVVSRDQNIVYRLDCVAALIYCTAQQGDREKALAAGFDTIEWRERRGKTTQRMTPGAARWLPLPSDWNGINGRGAVPMNNDVDTALAALAPGLVDVLLVDWQKRRRRLDRMALELELASRQIDLPRTMQDIARWYGTRTGPTPDVVLIASGTPKSGSIATRDGNRMYVESTLGDSGRDRLPVVAHEWAHQLFEQMPVALSREIITQFEAASSVCAAPAYLLMDEVLATVISDELIARQLDRRPQDPRYRNTTESYYADARIDRLAKAASDLVIASIEGGSRIDATFVTEYIAIADDTLGRTCLDLNTRMSMIGFIQHGADYDETYSVMRDRLTFKTAIIDTVASSDGSETGIAQFTGLTGIVLSDANRIDELTALAPPAILKQLADRARDTGAAVYSFQRSTHAELYFIVGWNPVATATAAMHFVARRPTRFRGGWLPGTDTRFSVPERDK
ncbi:MAG: hypothetical protein AAFV47_14860 [Pseudomonadota bacterium]